LGVKDENVRGYVSSTGSGGTLAAGDRLKDAYPNIKIGAGEALLGTADHQLAGVWQPDRIL
ncbi:MAG: hypothetical protein PHC30_08670, partial [Lentisphaeria bacterium]|nr:hypothetical protein [Lentisphaeria bacterium]